jgi:hypothetical protein
MLQTIIQDLALYLAACLGLGALLALALYITGPDQ